MSRIQVESAGHELRIIRPGARYVITRSGEEHRGAWLCNDQALPAGSFDAFPEHEARSLLPLLRARTSAGRPSRKPTTLEGVFVAYAKKELGMTASALAEAIGVTDSTLSKAVEGSLPAVHIKAIEELLKNSQLKADGIVR